MGDDAPARRSSSTSTACPSDPGVYIFRDAAGRPLYVGKSVSIRSRARAHFAPSTQRAAWTQHARIVDYRATCSELGALIVENRLIKELRPPGNVRLTRTMTASATSAAGSTSPFPVLEVAAAPAAGHAVSIGPLRGRRWVAELVEQLESLFALRHCGRRLPKREHPSAYGQMGRCMSPCLGDLDPNLYRRRLDEALGMFLGGADARERCSATSSARCARRLPTGATSGRRRCGGDCGGCSRSSTVSRGCWPRPTRGRGWCSRRIRRSRGSTRCGSPAAGWSTSASCRPIQASLQSPNGPGARAGRPDGRARRARPPGGDRRAADRRDLSGLAPGAAGARARPGADAGGSARVRRRRPPIRSRLSGPARPALRRRAARRPRRRRTAPSDDECAVGASRRTQRERDRAEARGHRGARDLAGGALLVGDLHPRGDGLGRQQPAEPAVRLAAVEEPRDRLLADVAALRERDGALVEPGLLRNHRVVEIDAIAGAPALDAQALGGVLADRRARRRRAAPRGRRRALRFGAAGRCRHRSGSRAPSGQRARRSLSCPAAERAADPAQRRRSAVEACRTASASGPISDSSPR